MAGRKCTLAGQIPAMVARILAAYHRASREDIARGLAWYRDAGKLAAEIGRGDQRKGAGLIAAYSPGTPWKLNVRNARARAAGIRPGTFGMANRWGDAIMAGADWADVLTGPKTRAFAANIAGDMEPVTVDRHAIRAATGQWLDKVSPRQYEHIAEAYRIAAGQAGYTPADMQAIVWCATRGVTGWDESAA